MYLHEIKKMNGLVGGSSVDGTVSAGPPSPSKFQYYCIPHTYT